MKMTTGYDAKDDGHGGPLRGKFLNARLHSLTLESPEPERLSDFYARSLGFSFTGDEDRVAGVALDRRLTFTRGAARRLAEAHFETNEACDLDSLEERLLTAGIPYSRDADAAFRNCLSFADLDGNRLRFGHDAIADERPVPAGAIANRTARLQHMVLGSVHAEPLIRFYCEVVGFRTSDTVVDDVGVMKTAFLNCGRDHHSVAIFATSENRLDHFCFEAGDWALIRDWSDHFSTERIPLKWGPGRHGPGNNLFVFIHDIDGNWVELSAELEQIEPDRPTGRWRHEERTLNSWGDGKLRS